jgi:dihydroxycyclohexadiene carboxylate dehydrogenase
MTTHNQRFTGKVAVVTGAAQGIGFAAATRLGREGARIVVADNAVEATREAVEALVSMGVTAIPAISDLSTWSGAELAMSIAAQAFGGIHVLVNNVGGTIWKKPFWHYSEAEIRLEIDRSFWPSLWCSRAVIPHMRDCGGAIVNLGSNAVDGPFRVPYSACKGAVAALTTALAVELADFNIRVNCVSPGGTEAPARKTPRNPQTLSVQELEWERQFMQLIEGEDLLGRFSTAEEQAAVIAFLASGDAGHVTGEIINTGRRGSRMSRTLGCIP